MNSIFRSYNVFFVDLFGVLWDGIAWIDGALNTLETLISNGKTVIILSNAAFGSNDYVVEKYSKLGLKKGIHFSEFVTSGGVLRSFLQKNEYIVDDKANCTNKYFVLGKNVQEIFADTNWEHTEDLDAADFVYVSIPQLTQSERDNLPADLQKMLFIGGMINNEEIGWEATKVDPFLPKLRKIIAKNKTLVVANPDTEAFCPIRETPTSDKLVRKLLIRQGAIGKAYEQMGGKVKYIGKPHHNIYDYVLKMLGNSISREKMIMIGDTLETDILGAQNASKHLNKQIDSVMVMTGVSANEMNFDISDSTKMNEFFAEKKIRPTHIMSNITIDAQIIL